MSISFNKTYRLEQGPSHLPVPEYVENCERRFLELLESNPAECEVQSFLEKHPSLVPGHSTPSGVTGHFPWLCSLITQPELPGRPSYKPDFMWIARHSGGWFPTLIEIEKPDKKIFTKKGYPTSAFSQARSQLNQWRSWFNNPNNVQQFIELYGIPPGWQRLNMRLHMYLIYGRRAEFEEKPVLNKQRDNHLPGNDEELMSFDRLKANPLMVDAVTVRATGTGKFQAVNVPPVFATGPSLADRLLYIDGMPEAINSNEEIKQERKDFLKDRIIFWKEWAATSPKGIISPGDRE